MLNFLLLVLIFGFRFHMNFTDRYSYILSGKIWGAALTPSIRLSFIHTYGQFIISYGFGYGDFLLVKEAHSLSHSPTYICDQRKHSRWPLAGHPPLVIIPGMEGSMSLRLYTLGMTRTAAAAYVASATRTYPWQLQQVYRSDISMCLFHGNAIGFDPSRTRVPLPSDSILHPNLHLRIKKINIRANDGRTCSVARRLCAHQRCQQPQELQKPGPPHVEYSNA